MNTNLSAELIKELENEVIKKSEEFVTKTWRQLIDAAIQDNSKYRYGIITALPKEHAAVVAAFGGESLSLPQPTKIPLNISIVECESINTGEAVQVVLAQCIRMGNNSAAVTASILLSAFPNLEWIILSGIAGGMPHAKKKGRNYSGVDFSDHVRLGDIVVSKEAVLQYDLVKASINWHENRSKPCQPDPGLLQIIDNIESNYLLNRCNPNFKPRWESHLEDIILKLGCNRPSGKKDVIYSYKNTKTGFKQLKTEKLVHPNNQKNRTPGKPLLHYGTVGSANILLKDPVERDCLREEYNFRAIEMEGSGVADAAWSFRTGYLVVRGICDYCDMNKNKEWQDYAAAVAAAFTRTICEQVPE